MRCPEPNELPSKPREINSWPWTSELGSKTGKTNAFKQLPTISIVTPSYNQGRYIEETIRSVLLQGYPNLEYIIIDGRSTDNTIEIIKKYEPWLTYWVSEKDNGQSHAINKGFSIATGEWLGWINSDDMLAPNALLLASFNLNNGNSQVIAGASEWINEKYETVLKYPACPIKSERMLKIWDDEGRIVPASQASIIFDRNLLMEIGPIREDLDFVMDWELWLRFYAKGVKWKYIEEVFSYIRRHDEQKTSEKYLHKKFREMQKVFLQYSCDRRILTKWQNFYLRFEYARKGWTHRNYCRSHLEMISDIARNPLPFLDFSFYNLLFSALLKYIAFKKSCE